MSKASDQEARRGFDLFSAACMVAFAVALVGMLCPSAVPKGCSAALAVLLPFLLVVVVFLLLLLLLL